MGYDPVQETIEPKCGLRPSTSHCKNLVLIMLAGACSPKQHTKYELKLTNC